MRWICASYARNRNLPKEWPILFLHDEGINHVLDFLRIINWQSPPTNLAMLSTAGKRVHLSLPPTYGVLAELYPMIHCDRNWVWLTPNPIAPGQQSAVICPLTRDLRFGKYKVNQWAPFLFVCFLFQVCSNKASPPSLHKDIALKRQCCLHGSKAKCKKKKLPCDKSWR